MRKQHQNEILQMLKIIKEAQSAGKYMDCQAGTSALLDFIDGFGGQGTKTIVLLEEYYKLLYKASIQEVKADFLKKHLFKIKNSVERELKPNRLEVAFISHKASMSDSIESIYLAAKADPACDAFWIPVPYYEHNKEGKPETLCFEGAGHYGPGIDITPWEKYDFEARRPDVIFTFSAYDANNKVSSIHPDFYCERLHNLTTLLVYVPYFVTVDEPPERFCTLAACIYSNIVILQSEQMRDFYVRIFKKAFGNRYGNPDNKFIALGSPKFDKVINTKTKPNTKPKPKQTDLQIPDTWQRIIGDKKVISYVSSIGSSLETRKTYLHKLQYILEKFKKRDDVVLWWRPHPLIESAFQTMMPERLRVYRMIVSKYKSEGWGIYDDTPNLHRAIAAGDGFYGDWGSLLLMYQVAGKPVMLADTTTLPEVLNADLGDCQYESDKNTIDDFAGYVLSGVYEKQQYGVAGRIVNSDGTAGQAIYDYVKRVAEYFNDNFVQKTNSPEGM